MARATKRKPRQDALDSIDEYLPVVDMVLSMVTPAQRGPAKTAAQVARLATYVLQRVSERRKVRRLKAKTAALTLVSKDGIDTREEALKKSVDALIDAVLAYV